MSSAAWICINLLVKSSVQNKQQLCQAALEAKVNYNNFTKKYLITELIMLKIIVMML